MAFDSTPILHLDHLGTPSMGCLDPVAYKDMGIPQDLFTSDMEETEVTVPFPAQTKQAAGEVDGKPTDVMSTLFADKILVTIIQKGRIGQWVTGFSDYIGINLSNSLKVNVPLLNDNPTQADPYFQTLRSDDDALIPASRFAPRTLLGAGNSDRETMGHLFASQIAQAIITKNPEESRPLLLGLGLGKVDTERDAYLQIIDLVLQVL